MSRCFVTFVQRLTSSQVYLQQNKKKAEAESKNCHAKTMLSLEKPIKASMNNTPHVPLSSFFFLSMWQDEQS